MVIVKSMKKETFNSNLGTCAMRSGLDFMDAGFDDSSLGWASYMLLLCQSS